MMTGLVSADRYNDYVVQLKTHWQKSHYKNNQLYECATINPKINGVIDGKVPYLVGKDGCYMQSAVALFVKTSL